MSFVVHPREADHIEAAPRPFFGHSDLLIAAAGALIMAVAGAGVASWFGPGDFGAAYADSYTASPTPIAALAQN